LPEDDLLAFSSHPSREARTLIVSHYIIPGMKIRDHVVQVPLDWNNSEDGRTIEIFAREVVNPVRDGDVLPKLLFLQGGPGGKSPRPGAGPVWLTEALKTHRVILLDQRGTGRSSRIEASRMGAFAPTERLAETLCLYRADSIVRDAEHLRKTVFGGLCCKLLSRPREDVDWHLVWTVRPF
jgi:proline iminopeptidase